MMRLRGLFLCCVYLSGGLVSLPVVALGLSVPGVQAQATPVEVREGYALLRRGWINDAIRIFQRAVQRYPQSLDAKLGLAIAYRRAGKDGDAFQTYEQVLRQDPTNPLALKSLGLLSSYRPEWHDRGIAALTTLLNLNPGDAEARAQRAVLYGYEGRFAEALADYQLALQQRTTPDVVLGAAQVYVYSGNYGQGLELFNRYLQTGKPIQGFAILSYARALRLSGNPAQAIQVLQSQISRQPHELATQLRVELALAYLSNQDPTRAMAALDPLRGRPDAILPLARGLNEIGRQTNTPALLSEAAQLYRQALTRTPNPAIALVREVADVLSGQPSEREYVLQLYRQLVSLEPNDKGLQLKRLALENQLGYLAKSDLRQALRSLLQPLPTDPGQLQAIAQGLVRISPDPELLSVYQTLLQTPGINEPFLNFRVAQILTERNDLAGARNALAVYTSTPQSRSDLAPQLLAAEIERREGNLEAAARRYEAVIALNPSDRDVGLGALRGLAGIRLAQGRPNDALQLYDQLVSRNPQDLPLQLGRASIAYQSKRISVQEAEVILNTWLRSRPASDTPPELFSLVGALPPDAQREPVYISLMDADPTYIPVQLRYVQVLARRDRALAQDQVNQIVARRRALGAPQDVNTDLLQGQLAQAINNYDLANDSYLAVLARQPDNADALVGLGDIRFQQRRLDAAEGFYNRALAFRPNDVSIRRSLIEVNVVQDYPMTAIQKLEQLQLQQYAQGSNDPDLARRQQKIEEDLLQRRGFQPPWERF